MTSNSNGDGDESEIVRVVERYFDPAEDVSDDELREHLERDTRGTIVELDPEGAGGIMVVVEQAADNSDQTVRNAYTVRRVTNLDGEPALDWRYLGPAK